MTDQADEAKFGPGPGQVGGRPDSGRDDLDARALARDWITLWQSELTAMAADQEIREGWQTTASLWAAAMTAILRTVPRGPIPDQPHARHDGSDRRTSTPDAPRAAPVAAAPDPRDAEIDRLARHVAALERRLADLERDSRQPSFTSIRTPSATEISRAHFQPKSSLRPCGRTPR